MFADGRPDGESVANLRMQEDGGEFVAEVGALVRALPLPKRRPYP